jgi:hypothetical protein
MESRQGTAVVPYKRPRRFRPVHRLRLMAVRVLDPISWYMQKQERVDLQALRNSSHPGTPSHVSTVDAYVPTPRDRPLTHDEILKFQTQIGRPRLWPSGRWAWMRAWASCTATARADQPARSTAWSPPG